MQLDVAIVGGGLAGNTLARQLVQALPGLRIGLFERRSSTSWKVGESSVEIACNYFTRRLGLDGYMYQSQLPKNGLRFFFDTPERDADLPDMSEIGSRGLPHFPSFQIDRARMEDDLLAMNAADGVLVRRGVKAERLEISDHGEHRFVLTDERGSEPASARWFVDTTGRARIVQKTLGLRRVDVQHPIAAVWGRFHHVVDMDRVGPPSWRARVCHTARFLSTNHFCYPGYWIWFIPLGRGVMSVGFVGDRKIFTDEMRTRDGFIAFLERHRAVADLLVGSEFLDVMSYGQLAYGTELFFDPRGAYMTGEAAAFVDPFYSPGSDFIAMENDLVTDLIRREAGGESRAALAELVRLYDRYMHQRFEGSMLLYRDLYSLLGSYDLLRLKWELDIACYYNLWLDAYMRDEHLDPDAVDQALRQQPMVHAALRNFSELFQTLERSLWERGAYHRNNLGHYSGGIDHVDFVERVGAARPRREVLSKTSEIFNDVRARALDLLGSAKGGPSESLPLHEFLVQRSLC